MSRTSRAIRKSLRRRKNVIEALKRGNRLSHTGKFESLEERTMFSVTVRSPAYLPGNSPDVPTCNCTCNCPTGSPPSGSQPSSSSSGSGSFSEESSDPAASSSSAPPVVYQAADGSLVVSVYVGGFNFVYNSSTANPDPLMILNSTIDHWSGDPSTFEEDIGLEIKNIIGTSSVHYNAPEIDFDPDQLRESNTTGQKAFAFQIGGASQLPTGRYLWASIFQYYHEDSDYYPSPTTGESILKPATPTYHTYLMTQDIINRSDSQFGAGWWLPELDRLVITAPPSTAHGSPLDVQGKDDWDTERVFTNTDEEHSIVARQGDFDAGEKFGYKYDAGALLVTGNNQTEWFTQQKDGSDNYDDDFVGESDNPASFGTLSKQGDNYDLRNPDGTHEIFDTDGYLIQRIDLQGQVSRRYDYDSSHNLTTITDYPDILTGAHARVYTFDSGLAVTDHVGTDGEQAEEYGGSFEYTGGLITSVQGARGGAFEIAYDSQQQVGELQQRGGMDVHYKTIASKILDVTGEGAFYTYNPANSSTDLYETQTEGEETFSVHRSQDVGGSQLHWQWLATSVEKSSPDTNLNNITTYQYTDGVLTSVVAPNPTGNNFAYVQDTDYNYHPDGYFLGATLPGRDYQGWQLTSITAADDNSADVVYSYTDGVHTTYYTYADGDTSGKPIYTTTDGIVTHYKYTDGSGGTPAGLVQDVIDAQGHDTHYVYAGLLISTITTVWGTPDAQTTTYEYDDRGNVKYITDPAGRRTKYIYNFSDLLIERDDPNPVTGVDSTSQAWHYGYDANGNMVSIEDPLGNTTTYEYDDSDHLHKIFQPNPTGSGDPLVTEYDRDEHGNVETMIDPMNNVTTYQYDDILHLPTKQYAPDPTDGQFHSSTSPLTTYTYNLRGWLTGVSDPNNPINNNTTAYIYDQAGQQTYQLQLGADLDLTLPGTTGNYHVGWEGAIYIPASGATTFYLQNTSTAILSIDGNQVLNSGGETTEHSSYPVDLWQGWHYIKLDYYHYDGEASSLVLKYKPADATGSGSISIPVSDLRQAVVDKTEYNSGTSLVHSTTDPMGHQTFYQQYNSFDVPTQVTLPDPGNGQGSSVYNSKYDKLGNKIVDIDPLTHATQYIYDDLNRLIQTIQPIADGHSTSPIQPDIEYHGEWGDCDCTNEGGSATLNFTGLDDSKHYALIVNWDHNTSDLDAYDKDAQFQIDDSVHTLSTQYINLNFDPDNEYLGGKNLGAYQSHNHNLTLTISDHNTNGILTFDSAYLVEVGPVTTYTYDAIGNKTSETDPDGNKTTWTYDKLNRVHVMQDPRGNNVFYEYDANGNLTEKTDRLGRTTYYDYDHLNRQSFERWRNSANTANIEIIAYHYNDNGWLTSVTDQNSSGANLSAAYGYTYDHLGRVTASTIAQAHGVSSLTLNQTFDANSQRTNLSFTYSDNFIYYGNIQMAPISQTYGYDALERMTSIDETLTYLPSTSSYRHIDISYNAAGQFDKISRYNSNTNSSGALVATSSYGYDDAGRLKTLTYANNTTTIAGYGYEYDLANRLTNSTNSQHPSEDAIYTYDSLGQLTGVVKTGNNESYSYDDNGNRLTANGSNYTVDPDSNQITSDDTYNYLYDDEGNLIRRTSIADSRDYTVYTYDYRNRLTDATTYFVDPDPDPDYPLDLTEHKHYVYDAFDRLIYVGKIDDTPNPDLDNSGASAFVYDGNQILLQVDGGLGQYEPSFNNFIRTGVQHYLWGPAVDMLMEGESVPRYNSTFSYAPGAFWRVTDGQNSVRGIVNGNTAVTGDYSAFGSLENGGFGTILYTGRYTDPDTGLQYNTHRWYNPSLGRWMSEDPIGFNGDSSNLYRYVGNSPTNGTDPTGLFLGQLGDEAQGNGRESSCVQNCLKKAIGLGAGGGAMVISGQPFFSTETKLADSVVGTSLASKICRHLPDLPKWFSPKSFPTPIWSKGAGWVLRWTPRFGAAVGRWIPIVGWALIAADAAKLTACIQSCCRPAFPPRTGPPTTTPPTIFGPYYPFPSPGPGPDQA